MSWRASLLGFAVVASACGLVGPLKDPFAGLSPGGACASDADCVIARCPNACNQGQPFCTYPPVFRKVDVEAACPCAKTPTASNCAAPNEADCGPQPGCAGPFDVDQLEARCVQGACAQRFADGGVVPAP